MNNKKLQGKDLINIGIYTAIYFVLCCVAAFTGYIPIFLPLLTVIVPIVCGIPFMLYVTKIKKFGMLTISGLIIGIGMFITGMGYFTIFTGVLGGLIADLLLKSGEYKSKNKAVLACSAFHLWLIGNFLPFYLTRKSYFATMDASGNYVSGYTDELAKLLPYWMLPVLLVASLVCGYIGGVIGNKLLKKHFKKAGIV